MVIRQTVAGMEAKWDIIGNPTYSLEKGSQSPPLPTLRLYSGFEMAEQPPKQGKVK